MGCIVPFRLVADIDIYDQCGPCVLLQVIGSESCDARFREICNNTANATFVKNARLAAGLPEKHEAAGPVAKMLGCIIVPSWSFWKPANAESPLVAWLRKIASPRNKVRPVGFVACPILAAAWCDPLLDADNHTQDRLSHQMVVCTPRLWLSPGVDGHACLEPLDGDPLRPPSKGVRRPGREQLALRGDSRHRICCREGGLSFLSTATLVPRDFSQHQLLPDRPPRLLVWRLGGSQPRGSQWAPLLTLEDSRSLEMHGKMHNIAIHPAHPIGMPHIIELQPTSVG